MFGIKKAEANQWFWVIVAATAPVVWGTTYIVTTQLLPAGHPVWSSVLRALPGGLIGLLICRKLPQGQWIWRSFAMALLNMGIWFPMLFVSAYRLPGGVASVLSACQPLFVVVFSWLLMKESSSLWRIVWGFAGVAGIALMVLAPDATLDPLGIAAGIIGTASMAAGIVMTKRWGRPTDGFTWASWLLSWTGIMLIPVALLVEGTLPKLDIHSLIGFAWLSIVGGLLTYWAWFTGLGRISAGSASFLPLLSPLVATLLGIVFLGEMLGPLQWVGFALCLTAILLAQLTLRPKGESLHALLQTERETVS